MSQPSTRRIALATGLSYNVLEWGAASAADHTVLLLHGFLDNAWTWEELVDGGGLTGGDAHVVAADWRGHGDSEWLGAGGYYHFMDYVADLASLVSQVARRRLSIIAHSMGCSAAGYYAGTWPARVERLVLIEAARAGERVLDPSRMALWIGAWREARTRGTRAYPTLERAAARLRISDPELDAGQARRLAERGTRKDPDGQLRFKHDPLHTTPAPYPFSAAAAEQFWRAITAPVLFIDGATSPFRYSADERERRRAAFRDARTVVVDGTGHWPHRHRPRDVGRLIAEHLK